MIAKCVTLGLVIILGEWKMTLWLLCEMYFQFLYWLLLFRNIVPEIM